MKGKRFKQITLSGALAGIVGMIGTQIASPIVVHASEDNVITQTALNNNDIIYVSTEFELESAILAYPNSIIILQEHGLGRSTVTQTIHIPGTRIEQQTGLKFITGSSVVDSVILSVAGRMCKMNFWTSLGIGVGTAFISDLLNGKNALLKESLYQIAKRNKTGVVVKMTGKPGGYPVATYSFQGYY